MVYLVGGLLVVSGSLVIYGAITGRLATMLGALIGVGKPASGSNAAPVSPINPKSPNFPSPIPGISMGNLKTVEGWIARHLP